MNNKKVILVSIIEDNIVYSRGPDNSNEVVMENGEWANLDEAQKTTLVQNVWGMTTGKFTIVDALTHEIIDHFKLI